MKKGIITSINVKPEKLDLSLFNSLVNLNGEPYVRHFLCSSIFPVNPFSESENNNLVNQIYRSHLKLYEEYLKKDDFDGVFLVIEKQYRLVWFIKNYKKIYSKVGEKKYYKLLGGILVMVDEHYKTKKHYSKLLYIGNDTRLMMNTLEKKEFNKLPNEILVYRGLYSKKKLDNLNFMKFVGNSWSLDVKKSVWFSGFNSMSNQVGNHYILQYKIQKENIVSYFSSRKEKEIFLDFNKIEMSKITLKLLEKDYVFQIFTK